MNPSIVGALVLLPFVAVSQNGRKLSRGNLAKAAFVRSDLANVKQALDGFRRDCGRYPTTQEGLSALMTPVATSGGKWNGPYITSAFTQDAWARPFWYVATDTGYAAASFGADGKPGGTGADEDLAITN